MPRWLRLASSLGALVVGMLSGATAWSADPLELETVLASVEATHPTLESAARDVERADGENLSARGGFDPTLTIRGKYTPVGYYQTGEIDTLVRQPTPAWGVGVYAGYRLGLGNYAVYKGDLQTLSGGELRAGLDVPVWRDGPIDKRRAEIRKSNHKLDSARASRDATQLELSGQAAASYWDWVAAGRRLTIARSLLAIAERRDAGLNEQATAGAIERIKVVDNRRLVLDRMAKVVEAERKFETATLKLSLYYRDEDNRPIRPGEERVPPSIPEPTRVDVPSLDREVDQAVRRRPDVEALAAKRRVSDVQVRLATNQRAPKVNVQGFVAKDFGAGPPELAPVELGVGLMVEMPLPLRKARGDLQAAKAERASVDAKMRGLYDEIGAEVRTAYVALQAAEQSVVLAREQVSVAQQLAEAERTRFSEGLSDLVIVNLRELAAAEAATQEVDALADYHRAHAEFLVSTGRPPASPG